MNAQIDISDVVLKTQRLTLRPFCRDDLDDLFEYASVDGVGQPAGWSPHKDKAESQRILDMFIANKNNFAIVYNGKVVGSLGVERYDESLLPELADKQGRELGYVLAADLWGRGLMTEAVQAVIRYLFEKVGLDFLVCGHSVDNQRSYRVQQKCGFVHVKQFMYHTSAYGDRQSWLSLLNNSAKNN